MSRTVTALIDAACRTAGLAVLPVAGAVRRTDSFRVCGPHRFMLRRVIATGVARTASC